jgi:hypothetical protein
LHLPAQKDTMATARNTHHTKRNIILICIGILLVAIFSGIWYWNTHKKGIIKKELTDAVNKKTNGLYTIHYGSLDMDELKGHLVISNIHITYDSLKLDSLMEKKSAAAIVFKIKADSLIASGIKTPKALLENEIVGSNLRLVNPTIEIIYTGQGKDSIKHETHKELYEQILGNLKLIKIDTVSILNGQLTTRKFSKKKNDLTASSFFVSLNNVLVDSLSGKDTSRLFFAQQSITQCKAINWHSEDGLYRYAVKQMTMNTQLKQVTVDTFLLDPLHSEESFMKLHKVQKDRYNFNMHNIKIDGLSFYQLFTNDQFIANKMSLSNSSFKIYRDLNMPHDSSLKVGKYPQQALMKVKLPLYVPTIALSNCFVEYKEKNKKTEMDGKVQFHNVNATLNNVTNMKQKIKGNDLMVINISTDFLDKIPFKVKWVMYLMDRVGKFTIDGTIGAFDGPVVNKVTEPMGPARVESGNIQKVKFDFIGSDYNMDGNLFLLYDNLKVSLLNEKDDKLKKKGLQSALANMFIKNANPMKGKEVRITPVHYERDKTRSVFSMIWKSIFTGVKNNIGLKK